MKPITVKTPVELEVSDIFEAMSWGEAAGFVSALANYFQEKKANDFNDRRAVMLQIEDHLSESGRRFFLEIAGIIAARHRSDD